MRLLASLFMALPLLLPACDRAADNSASSDQPTWSGPRPVKSVAKSGLDRSHAGSPAPAAAFEDPQGGSATMSDFRGRPLLVNLWATWCAPCVVEMPALDALAEREDGRLQVLAISQDPDGQAKVATFFAERRLVALEPYIDPKLVLMPELGVEILPTTILYDAEGRELWRMTGIADWRDAASAALIAEAFAS